MPAFPSDHVVDLVLVDSLGCTSHESSLQRVFRSNSQNLFCQKALRPAWLHASTSCAFVKPPHVFPDTSRTSNKTTTCSWSFRRPPHPGLKLHTFLGGLFHKKRCTTPAAEGMTRISVTPARKPRRSSVRPLRLASPAYLLRREQLCENLERLAELQCAATVRTRWSLRSVRVCRS